VFNDTGDDLVSIDSWLSISDRWDMDKVDDSVWDFETNKLTETGQIEYQFISLMEKFSASTGLPYCTKMLKEFEEELSEDEKLCKTRMKKSRTFLMMIPANCLLLPRETFSLC
jgi:hypothetical protein